jgi:signal peptidase I
MIEAPSPYGPPPSAATASPVVAAVLSLLMPGLGHIYARRTLRGLAWLGVPPLVFGPVFVISMHMGAKPFLVFVAIGLLAALGLRIAVIFDTAWTIRRHPEPPAPIATTVLAAAFILAASGAVSPALRRFVVEAEKMPSASMVPTLVIGDHVFVDKLRSPGRGDLLVFPFPEHPAQDFLKRVVGMPGDRLEFRDGHPIINGVEVPSCLVGQASYGGDAPSGRHEGKVYLERLGGHAHLAFYDETSGYRPSHQGPYVVKADEVFIIGDNRWNSHDSRMWWQGQGGGVSIATVKGIPFVVWLSDDERGTDWSRTGLDLGLPHLPSSMADLQPALDACLAK